MADSRYQLESRIASGGMASVWRARDHRLDRPVAIKRLHSHLVDDPVSCQRMAHEIELASQLHHPNVVTVLDAGASDLGPFLVMELVEGETLRTKLQREGRLSLTEAARIAAGITDGLAHAHARGVLHRDIKPENVLIESATGRVVLTDFGIASSPTTDRRLTKDGSVVGTVDYLSPERGIGQPGDATADVYALAAVTYEMLTGRPPFRGENALAVALAHQTEAPRPPGELADVPVALEEVILRGLAKQPSQRYRDAAAFGAALAAALAPDATPTADLGAARRHGRTMRRWAREFARERTTRAAAAAYAALGSMSTYVLLQLAA